MPETAALNILNLNIDSIQAHVTHCKTNREQETNKAAEGCKTPTQPESSNKNPMVKTIQPSLLITFIPLEKQKQTKGRTTI